MAPLFITNIEYVALRLVRRFLLPADLHRLGRYLPYYRTNLAEAKPDQICRLYVDWLAQVRRSVRGRRVLEVGSGATNGAGYALACAGAKRVWCVEPHVALERGRDAVLLAQIADRHAQDPSAIAAAVSRCVSLADVGAGQADVILSHSVLEHVGDLAALVSQMGAALATGGVMLHIVDYRDHFFRYPLHFLQFSRWTWQHFLDPGDLPRWRLGHHKAALERAGFNPRVIHQVEDAGQFARIRPHVSCDFDLNDPNLGVLQAVLYCERQGSPRATVEVR
jgi:SAM-dependent methyltransferase